MTASTIAAHLHAAVAAKLRPRLDDELIVELSDVTRTPSVCADDVIAGVARAASSTTDGRPLVIDLDDTDAERWIDQLRIALTRVLSEHEPGPSRRLLLFQVVDRHIIDLTSDDGEHDEQRAWLRFHSALARVESRTG